MRSYQEREPNNEKHVFYGEIPINIFDFLTHFVNEADMLNISDELAFLYLPKFLADRAETQFRANLS